MRRGASNCGHIWGSPLPPRVRKCSVRSPGIGLLIIVTAAIALQACTGSSPRYRTDDDRDASTPDDDVIRFASKVREEEVREDDKKVDVAKVQRDLRSSVYSNQTPPGINRDKVLLDVVSYLGVPYAFGGSSKQGIDCSAFTSKVYESSMSVSLPRSTRHQFGVGREIGKSDLQFGDLVFFNTTGRGPSHVGIYLEDDLFAHASVTYGVTISSLESSYYRKRFLGARRVER